MRILFTFLSILLIGINTNAQTNLGISAQNVEAAAGTLVEVEVTIDDELWNCNGITGTITWDETIAEYSSITEFGEFFNPVMDISNFGLTQTDDGILTWSWFPTFTVGTTLSAGQLLFTVQFEAIGNDGDSTGIEFTDTPMNLFWNSGGINTGSFDGNSGSITIGGLNLTGCYDPQYWTATTDNTNGSISHAAGIITMTGDNDMTGNGTTGVDCEGTEGTISYCNTIPNDGTVSFEWDYNGNIDNADSDAFGYCLNGTSTQLALPPPPFGGTPFGSASFEVVAGDELCFVMSSENANQPNAPIATITDFVGPDCELPSLLATIQLVSPVVCNGDADASVQVNAFDFTGELSYSWDVDGVEGANPTGLGAGTYCVTVIDEVPDTSVACITITEAPEITVSSQANPDNGTGTGMALVTVSGGQPFTSPPAYDVVWDTEPVQTGFIATGLASGTYTFTVTDALGCEYIGEVTILYVGIEELAGLDTFNYYPNPAEGSFIVDIEFNESKEFGLSIMNAVGQKVIELGSVNSDRFNQTIDVSSLQSGFYFINIDVDGQRITRKLTVK